LEFTIEFVENGDFVRSEGDRRGFGTLCIAGLHELHGNGGCDSK
jgi:hypothetical protein